MFQGVGRTGAEPEDEDTEGGKKNTRKGGENNSTQLLFYPERQPVRSQTGNPNTKRCNDFINHAAAFTAPCDRQMRLRTNSSPVNSCQFTIIKTEKGISHSGGCCADCW